MNFTIVAVIFTAIAASVAVLVANREDRGMVVSIGAAWVIAAAIAFFLPSRPIVFVALGVMLSVVSATHKRGAVFLYLGVVAALPVGMTYDVPFPGLNFLIKLDYAKEATLILLAPVFFRVAFSKGPSHLKNVERLLLFFTLFTGVMSLRDLPFTSMLRAVVDQMLLIYIPFVVISRSLTTRKDFEWALAAIFASFVIVSMIGAISAVQSWNYYAGLADVGSAKAYFDFRNGFVRVGATVIPSLLGFLAVAGILLAMRYRLLKSLPGHMFLGCIALFGFATFATGARGGWLGAFACIACYYIFLRTGAGMRKMFYVASIAVVFAGFTMVFNDSDLLQDEYGTVSYRAELIRTSIEQIKDRPFFGSSDFMGSARFAHLRQGEGIIDLVNGYIQIVLFYGLAGLGAFVAANLIAIRGGLKELSLMPDFRAATPAQQDQRRVLAFSLSLQFGYLALIGTISLVNQVPNYLYIFLALLVAQARLAATSREAAEMAADAPAEAAPEEDQQAPARAKVTGPVPYGARFVRRT